MFTKAKIDRATRNFLKNEKMRTYKVGSQEFVLDFERDENWLQVTTWGCDYAGLQIPQTYVQLVNLKMRAQLGMLQCGNDQVAVRYYMSLMRAVN